MRNFNALFTTLSLATLLGCTSMDAQAGPYADDLGKCLVKSTTSSDKLALVRWLLATAALHPDVKPIAAVSAQQHDAFSRGVGALFERLLARTCRQEAQQAVKFEGESSIESSFQILGQVAARELFADSKVTAGMAEMSRHVDFRKSIPVARTTAAGPRIVSAPFDPKRITP